MIYPNPSIDRLKFIWKTHGKKHPQVVYDMVDIVAHTVGADAWKARILEAISTASLRAKSNEKLAFHELGHKMSSMFSMRTEDRFSDRFDPALVEIIIETAQDLPQFRTKHDADGGFPWMARELTKLAPDKNESAWAYGNTVRELKRRGTVFGQWLKKEKPDLGKMSLDAVLEELEGFEQDAAEIPQGEVVYKFPDGFTVQELTTKEQLDAEGRMMQHCVGSYCSQVKQGSSVIYSLRDKKGLPHVTIEFSPHRQRVVQVRGKQNDDPAPKYQPYVDEFKETLPKMSPRLQEIVDIIDNGSGWFDDESEAVDAAEVWDREIGDLDLIKQWVDVGMRPSREGAELANRFGRADVTPEEWGNWAPAVTSWLDEGHAWADFDKAVALGRIVDALDRAESRLEQPAQKEMWPAPPKKRLTKADLPAEWKSFQYIDLSSDRDWNAKNRFLFDAFRWYGTEVAEADPRDVEDWVVEGFTPEQADAWWHAGTEAIISPGNARRLVVAGYKPEDLDEIDISGKDARDLREEIEAKRLTTNRRRRSSRRR